MAQRTFIGEIAELPKGEGRTFAVAGQRLALFHTRNGEIFATQAECPHAGGPLADGLMGGTTVVCPLHERAFDLRTGQGLENGCAPLRTYPVSLGTDGKIWLNAMD